MRERTVDFHYKTNVFAVSGEISAILQRVTNLLLQSTYISTSRDGAAFSRGIRSCSFFTAVPTVK